MITGFQAGIRNRTPSATWLTKPRHAPFAAALMNACPMPSHTCQVAKLRQPTPPLVLCHESLAALCNVQPASRGKDSDAWHKPLDSLHETFSSRLLGIMGNATVRDLGRAGSVTAAKAGAALPHSAPPFLLLFSLAYSIVPIRSRSPSYSSLSLPCHSLTLARALSLDLLLCLCLCRCLSPSLPLSRSHPPSLSGHHHCRCHVAGACTTRRHVTASARGPSCAGVMQLPTPSTPTHQAISAPLQDVLRPVVRDQTLPSARERAGSNSLGKGRAPTTGHPSPPPAGKLPAGPRGGEAMSPRAVPRLPPRCQPLGWLATHCSAGPPGLPSVGATRKEVRPAG